MLYSLGDIRMSVEKWWNNSEKKETDVLGKEACHIATLCTSNCTWTHQASNPALSLSVSHTCKKKPAIFYLSTLFDFLNE